ncbi:acyltransferase family protein [Clostridium oryzae]|uniref:Acyltransferase family protein n=1 Tax=Clostridium oryzae TaxID=1450648 RepID=A0A1V4IH16_9CLOT|nr:acyltransferase [Clostridium oryzae]OPJ59243.1 acyltransferase family protein [Clostridium oryzae]
MLKNSRYDELDSLRGIAALIVFVYHMTRVFKWGDKMIALSHSVVYLLFDGHASVMFFYVLSGFVLSLPFFYGKKSSYRIFILKRFLRIYIPFLAAMVLSISVSILPYKNNIHFSSFYNLIWRDGLNKKILFNNLLLIGNYKTYAYDFVIWSLVHEMRISLIIPILVFISIKLDWKKIIAMCIVLSTIASLLWVRFVDASKYLYKSSPYETLHYISIFFIGILLSKYHKKLISAFKNCSIEFKLMVLIISLSAYGYRGWVPFHGTSLHFWAIEDWSIALGSCGLIIVALGSKAASKFLLMKPIHFLGKISFSFYLYHTICILLLFNLLYGKIRTAYIYIIITFAAFIISFIAYHTVEAPICKFIKSIRTNNTIQHTKAA